MSAQFINSKHLKRFFSLLSLVLAGAVLSCNTITNLPAAFQPTATLTPTATASPTPTSTPTPTPVTTGSLGGTLVEGDLGDESSNSLRPPLSNVLVMLCAGYSVDTCTTDADLATYTDQSGAFFFSDLEPGQYAVLYNPFKIEDGPNYLAHFDNRQLKFADASEFAGSVVDGPTNFYITAGPNGGVTVTFDQNGNMTLGAANANTAIYTSDFTLVAEFVDEGVPAHIKIQLGQTADLTLNTHVTLQTSETNSFEPAGEPIALPNTQPRPTTEAPAPLPTSTGTPAPDSQSTESVVLGLISEAFDDNRNNWNLTHETESWGMVTTDVRDGVLAVNGTMTDGMYYEFFPDIRPFSDGEVSVEVENISALAGTVYGLDLYSTDIDGSLNFGISDTGHFTVTSDFANYNKFALFEPTDTILQGQPNTLTVRMRGIHITCYINGSQVYFASIPDLPRAGQAGLYVIWEPGAGLNQTVQFDNFNVSVP